MKTPTQTNAIDFDSAKLQRLGFGQPSLIARRPISLAQLRQQLNLQLQTSLEAERILGLFFREVQRLVPLDALQYRHEASDLRLEYGQRGHHSVSYSLSHQGEHLGELVFRRNQRFSEEEQGNRHHANRWPSLSPPPTVDRASLTPYSSTKAADYSDPPARTLGYTSPSLYDRPGRCPL